MNLQEMLKNLLAQRTGVIDKMGAIHEGATKEARLFTDAEQKSFDDLQKEVADLDKQIKSTEAMVKLMGDRAASDPAAAPTNTDPSHTLPAGQPTSNVYGGKGTALELPGSGRSISVRHNLAKGTLFTRYAMALAASKGNLHQAAEIAQNFWGNSTPEVARVLKAAVAAGTTTDANWAKPLAEYQQMASEMIELLGPETIVGRMQGLRRVPMNVRIPRQTAGTSVGWVGQGGYKPVGKLQFDSVVIPPTKVAGIVVITQELARYSSPDAEALVRSDLLRAISEFTDAQFITPAVAAVANVSPASITNGVTSIPSTGGTVAQISADVSAAFTAMAVSGVPMRNMYWVMHPRSWIYLQNLRTSQDVLAFPETAGGNFRGIPVLVSTAVPANLGVGTNETLMVLIAAEEILFADDGQVMVDTSTEAAVAMDTAPSGATALTSLWQNNLVGIRAERGLHWLRRRDAAVQVIGSVDF